MQRFEMSIWEKDDGDFVYFHDYAALEAENAKLKEALRGCVEISKLCMCSTCTMESPVCNDGPCVIVKAFIKAREVLREGGAGAC
jgi:hypothetical protein